MLDFDLNLLPILLALYEERSVTKAARKLGMSQPSVSVSLKRLRETFGDRLFVRTSFGVEPTPRAKLLISETREILARVERKMLATSTFDPKETETTFTFALNELGEVFFFPPLVETLRKLAPHARIRSISASSVDIGRGLANGEIDLAFGGPKTQSGKLFSQKLFDTQMACIVRADHPIRGKRLSLKEYSSLDHIMVRGSSPRGPADKRRIVLTASHYIGLPVIIKQTDLAAVLLRPIALYFVSIDPSLKIVDVPPEIPKSQLYQFWHRKYHGDPRSQWLRALVKRLFPDKVREWLR